MKLLRFLVLSPSGIKLDKTIISAQVKTTEGYIGLNFNRAPLIAAIQSHLCKIIFADQTKREAIIGAGLMLIKKTEAKIFTENFVFADEVDINETLKRKTELERKIHHIKDAKLNVKIEQNLMFELLKLSSKKK
ncbi:F0F1 ATP synthase subunit epsilon [Mycoplasmoides genitalium]|uniref:ATP synthase epsilon chain n=1 Tax=Mycoplasma genitalium (strain ATCC 33530 / DSM 19775 / NCTC 10195 / G37) TaxID=243273 RepID=ATPE_MYCGE|nr:F0F1 ATP synthase subunit epsilon [Mycoplasmoides genitalium]P47638.1 RecName: Full=ATP synthase epsilon chain; AltName: Full=ATP synthase F1 sector epsilon subunit; AltName: Full=F-ATPase epsilon subunit [Mycoplasmoides genitalium G37]AAC71626.1 ATP synthase F1, epsilon subunit [Mycoplasmoides genitalium G37]ABY79472.1 ATP synthase F1, epsilon subunit [synthetic Mycoplasma genitalium JCVI-1.0]